MTRLLSLLVVVGVGIGGVVWYYQTAPFSSGANITPIAELVIGTTTLAVAIADTDLSRAQGLSGVERLKKGEGMLFVFDTDEYHGFWMKDMLFSIDMLWLTAEGEIIHIEENVAPESFPEVFTPAAKARYVVEVSAGFARTSGIRIGTFASLPENIE